MKKARPKKRVKRKPVKKRVVRRKSVRRKSVRKKSVKRKKIVKKRRPVKKAKKRVAKKKKVIRRKPRKKLIKKPKRRIIKRKPARKKPAKRAVKKKPVRKRKPIKRRKPMKRKPRKKPIKKRTRRKKVVKKRPKKKTRRKPRKKPIKKRKPAKRKPAKRIKKRVVKRRRRKKAMVRRGYSVGGPLEQLFESPVKVQTMKLFFRNIENDFLLKEAARIMKINLAILRKEMRRLEKIGLLKAKRISPRKELFSINPNFDFFNELKELILKASPVSKEKMLKAIKGLGKVKVILLSGVFVNNDTARADLLIVGDNINQRKLVGFIKTLEAEAGTDINCVAMTTEEFNYRYDMYDRFVRDLLNDKCEFLVNRLNI